MTKNTDDEEYLFRTEGDWIFLICIHYRMRGDLMEVWHFIGYNKANVNKTSGSIIKLE